LLMLLGWALAAVPARAGDEINLTPDTQFYVDSSGGQSLEDVRLRPFEHFRKPLYVFEFSPYTVWVRFPLKSPPGSQQKFILYLNNPYLDIADLYLPAADGTYTVSRAGDLTPFEEHPIPGRYPAFPLDFSAFPDSSYAYLKITNSQYNLFNVVLADEVFFYQTYNSDGFRIGMVVMRLFFHIALLLFLFKDTRFRAYSFWGIALCLNYLNLGGESGYLFPGNPFLVNYLFYLGVSLLFPAMCYYVYEVLNIRETYPRARRLLVFFGAVGIANLFIQLWVSHASVNRVVIGLLGLMILYFVYLIVRVYGAGGRPNIWYMVPLLLYIPTGIIYLRNVSFYFFIPMTLLQAVFILDFFFVAFLTGAMLRLLYKERSEVAAALYLNRKQSEKLIELDNAKTRFVANMSHEFRTPLTLILSPLEDLIRKYPAESVFVPMKRNAQKLLSLINRLLDISKMEAGEMQPEIRRENLVYFIRTHAGAFSSLADSRETAFDIRVPEEQRMAWIDTEKLQAIVNNLLSNAFKFTRPGDRVSVTLSYPDATHAAMEVKDSGQGISEEHLPHIFDRFYQAEDTVAGGTGIGLALVKELSVILKGEIRAESRKNEGSCFTFTFPTDPETWKDHLAGPEGEAPVIYREEEEPGTREGVLLLIIDDNRDVRHYLRQIFGEQYRVIEAEDGRQGLEKATAYLPDLVICDLMMPVLDGLAFCRSLKTQEATNHIPVVMLTARASVESRIEGFEFGADAYLTKPFHTTEIRTRVKTLIRQREILRNKFEMKIVDIGPRERKLKSGGELFIEKLKEVIEHHLSDNAFSMDDLAASLHLSPDQLRRKTRTLTGLRPVEFIRKYRLHRAAELLRSRSGTVSEVAYQVGFESLSYFTRAFREEFGQNPSDFA